MQPRILALVVGQLQHGGAERQLFELAVRLDRSIFRPYVVCLSDVTHPYAGWLTEAGIEVAVLPRAGHRDFGRVRRLARLLSEHRTDLSHSFLIAANAYTWAASWLAGKRPFIASSRTCIPATGWLAPAIHRKAFRDARGVIANSRRVMQFTCDHYGVPVHSVRVVHNGVALEDYAETADDVRLAVRRAMGVAPEEVLVGTIGRVSPEKNLGMLLTAVAAIPAQGPRCRVAIVGDGPALVALKEKAAAAGVDDRAIFTGERHDVAPLLGAFDIFALTSKTEGLPNAVMEAMAARRPVVATDVGGTAEVIEDGVSGFLVAPGDVGKMTQRIAELARAPERRAAVGAAARARIEKNFTIGMMVSRTTEIYEKALRGPLR